MRERAIHRVRTFEIQGWMEKKKKRLHKVGEGGNKSCSCFFFSFSHALERDRAGPEIPPVTRRRPWGTNLDDDKGPPELIESERHLLCCCVCVLFFSRCDRQKVYWGVRQKVDQRWGRWRRFEVNEERKKLEVKKKKNRQYRHRKPESPSANFC